MLQPQPPLHPHPPRPKALPQSPHPPHKRRRQIIHIQLLEPQSPHPLHPPQFVAAKSLINNPVDAVKWSVFIVALLVNK